MSSYPKWLYHPTKPALIVPDAEAHKAAGPGWVESPADVVPEPVAEAPEPPKAEPKAEPKPKKGK